jgi:pimeloyl-ACP methyl ester carboxylesterase
MIEPKPDPRRGAIMTSTTESCIELMASDGVSLAVWVDGSGPPLLLVHGSLQDHTANRTLVDELVGDFTTYSIDRRGFGASGDAASWSLDRDFEDLATIVDHIAAEMGEPVSVWGHSFGANVAMGAAAHSANVAALILYEPSLGMTFPDGEIDHLDEMIADGDRDGAVARYLRAALALSDEDVAGLRASPRWASMVDTVHTITRESFAEQGWQYDGQFASIQAPTLMVTGSDTPPDIRRATEAAAAAIGDPAIRVLDGHGHLAQRTDPALVARITREFARSCTAHVSD